MIRRTEREIMGYKWTIRDMKKDVPRELLVLSKNSQIINIFVVQNKAVAGATLEFSIVNRDSTDQTNNIVKTYYAPLSLATLPTKRASVAYDASILPNEKIHAFDLTTVLKNVGTRLSKNGNPLYPNYTLSVSLKGADATGADITIYIRRV